jgi:hypothetical protein
VHPHIFYLARIFAHNSHTPLVLFWCRSVLTSCQSPSSSLPLSSRHF